MVDDASIRYAGRTMRHVVQPAFVSYAVSAPPTGWELSEETMPESVLHDDAVGLLKALLMLWAKRVGGRVARNLAVRWDEARPQIGLDPDVAVFVPPPPEFDALRSVRTWRPGHTAPVLAIEVVSENDPRKDYEVVPEKYAASGTRELWIFDPLLVGPKRHGGPYRLQIWRREEDGFVRIFEGDGPAHSPELDAWLVPVDEGHKLRIAHDEAATSFWMTAEESAHAEKNAALARIAELEAELARGRRGE
jgi:Uma2 family endonuclease